MNANSILPTSELEDLDEAPIWTEEDFKTAVHRIGLKPVQRTQHGFNVEIDPDIAVWFIEKTSDAEFQQLINKTLRDAMESKKLEDLLRKVIREELQKA